MFYSCPYFLILYYCLLFARKIFLEWTHNLIYRSPLKIDFWKKNGCYIKIQALIVSEKARMSGVGKALIKCSEAWAKENNAELIALTCGNKNERESAHMFYPKWASFIIHQDL